MCVVRAEVGVVAVGVVVVAVVVVVVVVVVAVVVVAVVIAAVLVNLETAAADPPQTRRPADVMILAHTLHDHTYQKVTFFIIFQKLKNQYKSLKIILNL